MPPALGGRVERVIEQDVEASSPAGNEAVAVFKDGSNGGQPDDDLLAALDKALDEIEEEQRIEAVKERAQAAFDELEKAESTDGKIAGPAEPPPAPVDAPAEEQTVVPTGE